MLKKIVYLFFTVCFSGVPLQATPTHSPVKSPRRYASPLVLPESPNTLQLKDIADANHSSPGAQQDVARSRQDLVLAEWLAIYNKICAGDTNIDTSSLENVKQKFPSLDVDTRVKILGEKNTICVQLAENEKLDLYNLFETGWIGIRVVPQTGPPVSRRLRLEPYRPGGVRKRLDFSSYKEETQQDCSRVTSSDIAELEDKEATLSSITDNDADFVYTVLSDTGESDAAHRDTSSKKSRTAQGSVISSNNVSFGLAAVVTFVGVYKWYASSKTDSVSPTLGSHLATI